MDQSALSKQCNSLGIPHLASACQRTGITSRHNQLASPALQRSSSRGLLQGLLLQAGIHQVDELWGCSAAGQIRADPRVVVTVEVRGGCEDRRQGSPQHNAVFLHNSAPNEHQLAALPSGLLRWGLGKGVTLSVRKFARAGNAGPRGGRGFAGSCDAGESCSLISASQDKQAWMPACQPLPHESWGWALTKMSF